MAVDISIDNWQYDDQNQNGVTLTQRTPQGLTVTCDYTIGNDANAGHTIGHAIGSGTIADQQAVVESLRDVRILALQALLIPPSNVEDGNGCKFVYGKLDRTHWKCTCVQLNPINYLGSNKAIVESDASIVMTHAIQDADKQAASAKLVPLNNSLIAPPPPPGAPSQGERVIA